MKLENNLGTDPIRPLVLRIAIPSMLAQFVSVLYSIVDRIYISNIPVIGETALAGVGVCGPVVTLIGAFASLIGVGGAPLMSISMGAGKTEEARKILSNSFLMLCVCSVALMAAVFLIFRNSQKNLLLRHQEQLMKMNYERMAGQYAQIEELYAAQRRQIHDIRQQQILLADYLERGQVEEAKAYLKETSASLCRKTQNRYSGIATVDFILNYKENAGRERGISFQIEANVLFCPLKESEMCILLGNLLDNAIEACVAYPGEKRLAVKVVLEEVLFFSIQNTCNPVTIQNNCIATTKPNPHLHGFGLENVKMILKKYHGEFSMKYENESFLFVGEIVNTPLS